MRTYLLVLLVITSSVAAAPNLSDLAPIDERDYTQIRASVVDADLLSFPHARLSLMITRSSNPRILDLKSETKTLAVWNYFWTSLGRVDFTDPRNVGATAAYYLLQGDEIRAKLFAGSLLRDRWYVYGIARVRSSLNSKRPAITEFDGLELRLDVEREVYNLGDPIPLVLAVTNTTNRPKTLNFSSGQRYDFVVTQDGREIWRWSAGKAFIQALGLVTIQPNETLRFRETWSQIDNRQRHVQAGEYQIKGDTDDVRQAVGRSGDCFDTEDRNHGRLIFVLIKGQNRVGAKRPPLSAASPLPMTYHVS